MVAGNALGQCLFLDTTLPFGLRSAPKLSMAVADALEWIARQEGVKFVIHYLDDFLVLCAPDSKECAVALNKLEEPLKRPGFLVAVEKWERPATVLEFIMGKGFRAHYNIFKMRGHYVRPKPLNVRLITFILLYMQIFILCGTD